MAPGAVLVALQGAFFTYEGQPVVLVQGQTTAREGHPILKGRENLFGPLKVNFDLPAPAVRGGPQAGTGD
jgi:hypothetical protein